MILRGGGQINDTSDTSSIKPQKQLTEKQKRALNNDPKKGFLKDICKGEYIYTGCFIGVEIGAGLNNNISSTDGLDKYTTTFPINVHIGWQWYYWANAGLRVKVHFGYSKYSASSSIDDSSQNGQYTTTTTTTNKFDINSLQYGISIAWHPYDFIYGGKHTLGLHIEEGLEFSSFFGSGSTSRSSTTGQWVTMIPYPGADPSLGWDEWVTFNSTTTTTPKSFNAFTQGASTTSIGIHYFYKAHHQFALDYKIRFYGLGSGQSIEGSDDKIYIKPSGVIYLTYSYMF